MAITSDCGSHCGISGPRESHCDCASPETRCHASRTAPLVITRSDLLTAGPSVPMCDRWYQRAGTYRPWQRESHTIRDVTLVGTVDIRPDAVPYQDTPPSTLAELPDVTGERGQGGPPGAAP